MRRGHTVAKRQKSSAIDIFYFTAKDTLFCFFCTPGENVLNLFLILCSKSQNKVGNGLCISSMLKAGDGMQKNLFVRPIYLLQK